MKKIIEMKKNILFLIFTAVSLSLLFTSCDGDDLSNTSVIKESQKEENDFDRWLKKNYVTPYNIDLKYRFEEIESDLNYQLVPAEYKKAIQITKLVQYLCLEAYDEVTGSKEFIKNNFPKMIHLVGSAAYRNNGTMVLGTAEGGLKITLYYINQLQLDPAYLNYYYFKTIHHEFSHILHQTKPYSTDFNMISGPDYVSDTWNSAYPTEADALKKGFISPYSSKESDEDFVELIAVYVTNSPESWQEKMTTAGAGASIIKAKFEIVYNYMLNSWNIDLNELRDIIVKREKNIPSLDLDALD